MAEKENTDLEEDRSSHSSSSHSDVRSEQHGVVGDEAFPSPHLLNGITTRWFAADLSNSTAAAAVHDEVSIPGELDTRCHIVYEVLRNSTGAERPFAKWRTVDLQRSEARHAGKSSTGA